jgi:UDP-4-amino-4,6-dideoxy-N-acetyl-beta-L-altrosamine transaminase
LFVKQREPPSQETAAPLPFLPYSRQSIDEDDIAAVAAALKSDFLTTGPLVERFEAAFAEATGATCAVACNSGTAALHLAALALDLKTGEGVVVPTTTFLATANVVRMTGAEVVFADVDPATGLMTPETFDAGLARARTAGLPVAAAFPVHLNGQVCDTAGLAQVARSSSVRIVEDACHALGVDRIGACEHSLAACFSTHPVKAMATGEGGVVTTSDTALAVRMGRLRTHGMSRDASTFADRAAAFTNGTANPWYYEMAEIGLNYRLPDILCALGLSQLRKLGRFSERRREIAALYDRLLEPLGPSVRPVRRSNRAHGWHLYVVLIDFAALDVTRAELMKTLRASGIGTQVHYIPVHRQPYYRERYGLLKLPGADAYYERCLSLPLFPDMAEDDVHRVVDALRAAL